MFFKLMTLVHVCAAFPLKCPEPAQWRLRANGHCADPSKYFCLRNDLIKKYSENCTRSDFQQPGRKSVLRGGIDADVCSEERYQPFPMKFFSNASSHCIFLKSLCNEEGQVVYDHGNRNTDATCRCNYRHGYTFIVKPNHPCFCKPLQEDCSCFMKICSNSSHILSPDNKCMYGTDLFTVTQCRPISDKNDNYGKRPAVTENTLKEDNISVPVIHYEDDMIIPSKRPRKSIVVFTSCYITCGATVMVLLVLFIRRNSLQGRRKMRSKVRKKFEEAREKSFFAQRNGIFNWKLLKECLEPVHIFKSLLTGEFVETELWDSIKIDSRRSQMNSILTNALRNIQTTDDYDKFEAIVVKCNDKIILQTPKDDIIQVDRMVEKRFRRNRKLIEKELYPKDYIDSFLERFILSLDEHQNLTSKEMIRQKMAHSFLNIIERPVYIEKGSMQCLIDSLKEDDSKVLKQLSKLMNGALPNGYSNFIGDTNLESLIEMRDGCRNSILCKWTYLIEEFEPSDVIDQLYRAGLVDDDRNEIMRDKPRLEMVYSTLRNVVRRIDGTEMFLELMSILKKENPSIAETIEEKVVQKKRAKLQKSDMKKTKRHLQKLENDLQMEFDLNYIDTFVKLRVFDVDDHEIIWEAEHFKNAGANCFFEKISDINYIERGSIDCLAECLKNSSYRKIIRQNLRNLLLSEQMPKQEKNRTRVNIDLKEETLLSNKTDKFTKLTATLAFEDTDSKNILESSICKVAKKSPLGGMKGLISKPEDTKRSSVVIFLQSDGENVKFIVEKSIVNGDVATFIMNLLDDENIKMHMSSEKRYKLLVRIHAKDQQTESYLENHDNPKMRIIKANRKLLEDEYDPMPLLKAVFVGNLKKYKSIEKLSPEYVADFKQKFSEINKIPERRKRVKQFLNIAEDMIEADKLWELIEDTANTFSMTKMRGDLNSEQNYISSSDEGLIFKGKYEVWKTEEDVKSPLQAFILEQSKKRGIQHEDTMSNKDFERSKEIDLPGMRHAYELESDAEKSLIKTKGPTSKSDVLYKSQEPVNEIRQTIHQLEVLINKTFHKLEEPRHNAQQHVGKLETQVDFTNLRQSQVAVTKNRNPDNKSMEVLKGGVCGTVDKAASPLHVACFVNNIEIVKVLLDNKEDINKCEDNRGSPLYIACQQNHIELVKLLLDNKADINKCIENGVSPLHVACFCNHIELVKVLLNNKADINTCDDDGDTPLYIACLKNHVDLVKLLIDNKADINTCKATGASPLTVACYENHIETVKILLKRKADINKWDGNGATALYITCQNNHKEIVKLLIDNKADINKCADNGASPLNVACQNDHVELVKVLLENKADINKCDAKGATALYMACQNNHKEVVKLLLDNKADINACDDLGGPLYIACQQNYIELVKILLDNKADINKCRANGVPPLNVACLNNHIETVKILLDNEADINKCDDNGATALYMASHNNQKEVVQLLLDNKADINKCTHNGASPLNVACQNNHLELVKVLLENNADINTSDRKGATALYMACQNNHKDVVKLLLDNKADISAGDDLGGPLYIACQQNHIEVVKILLDNKADINKCRANGASPLNVACQNNHIETVKILLDNKADVTKRDDNGATALYMASQNNHKEVVQLLLAHNKADTQNDISDRGSLHIACRNNHIDTFKILLDNKADINKCNGNGATALYMAFQIYMMIKSKSITRQKCTH